MPRRSELKPTKRAVDALSVEAKDAVFWDRDLAGFGVRAHATGRKVYITQARGSGGPKRVAVGRHGVIGAEQARQRAALIIDRIKRGEDPTPKPPEAELTIAALAGRFMRVHAGVRCKPDTAAAYRSVVRKHIAPTLHSGRARAGGGVAPAAVRHASGCEHSGPHPVAYVPSGRGLGSGARRNEPLSRNRQIQRAQAGGFLTPAEFRRLGRALTDVETKGGATAPAVAAIRLLMLTGCRKLEILALH